MVVLQSEETASPGHPARGSPSLLFRGRNFSAIAHAAHRALPPPAARHRLVSIFRAAPAFRARRRHLLGGFDALAVFHTCIFFRTACHGLAAFGSHVMTAARLAALGVRPLLAAGSARSGFALGRRGFVRCGILGPGKHAQDQHQYHHLQEFHFFISVSAGLCLVTARSRRAPSVLDTENHAQIGA